MTKSWWGKFDKYEKQWIVYFFQNKNRGGRTPYYPDDCVACGVCGNPYFHSPCEHCSDEFERLCKRKGAPVPNY